MYKRFHLYPLGQPRISSLKVNENDDYSLLHATSRPWRYQRVLHAGCLSERRLSEHAGELQMFLQGRFGVRKEPMCDWWVTGLPVFFFFLLFFSFFFFFFGYLCFLWLSTWMICHFSCQNVILIPKWNLSSVRDRVSKWPGSVLPVSVWVQGLRASSAHAPHPGGVLLHCGQSLGTQLWKMSSGGHRWVDGDEEEQLQAEKKKMDILLS